MKSKQLLFYLVLFGIIMALSCRKEPGSQHKLDPLVAKAKSNFYSTMETQGPAKLELIGEAKSITLSPVWYRSYRSNTSELEFSETPVSASTKEVVMYNLSGNKHSDAEYKQITSASFMRLLSVERKGRLEQYLLTYIPDLAYLKANRMDASANQINKIKADFNGYIEYRNLTGERMFVLRFENGRMVKRFSVKGAVRGTAGSRSKPGVNGKVMWSMECDWVCYPVYSERECRWAGDPPEEVCTEAEYLGEECNYECIMVPDPEDPPGEDPCDDPANLWLEQCGGTGEEPQYPTNFDCANVENGTAYMTDCGCIGGTTGITECPKDPCLEKNTIATRASRPIIKKQDSLIRIKTATGDEYGTERNLMYVQSTNYRNTTVYKGTSNTFNPTFTWSPVVGYTIGVSHGHPSTVYEAPSPEDAILGYTFLAHLQSGSVPTAQINTFKNLYSITTISPTYTYVMTGADWTALQSVHAAVTANVSGYNTTYITNAQAYMTTYNASQAEGSTYALLSITGSSINLYRAATGTTNFEPIIINSSGRVAVKPCP